MADWISPLDLKTILVNTFAGSYAIFGFIAFIFIGGMAAYFRMPNIITLAMFVLFIIIMGFEGLYALVILLVGLSTFWAISKIFKS